MTDIQLFERIEVLEEAVRQALAVFDNYANLHYSKGTEDGDSKGDMDAYYAIIMEEALESPNEEEFRKRIVRTLF